jgi:hypothetical protein
LSEFVTLTTDWDGGASLLERLLLLLVVNVNLLLDLRVIVEDLLTVGVVTSVAELGLTAAGSGQLLRRAVCPGELVVDAFGHLRLLA